MKGSQDIDDGQSMITIFSAQCSMLDFDDGGTLETA